MRIQLHGKHYHYTCATYCLLDTVVENDWGFSDILIELPCVEVERSPSVRVKYCFDDLCDTYRLPFVDDRYPYSLIIKIQCTGCESRVNVRFDNAGIADIVFLQEFDSELPLLIPHDHPSCNPYDLAVLREYGVTDDKIYNLTERDWPLSRLRDSNEERFGKYYVRTLCGTCRDSSHSNCSPSSSSAAPAA